MNPSDLIDKGKYPQVHKFLGERVDMLFDDMRAMLKHPLPENNCKGGCNFALFNFMVDVVSGISITLYDPKELEAYLQGKGNKDFDHFKDLLNDFYPWREEGVQDPKGIIDIIWDTRNSLTHRIGLVFPGEKQVKIRKCRLSDNDIRELEDISRFNKYDNLRTFDPKENCINLIRFYRGTYKMLNRLFTDSCYMNRADAFFENANKP
ncbi:MAG: hypothetical protein QXH64_04470, partial [Nitrososphaeria archaeon]